MDTRFLLAVSIVGPLVCLALVAALTVYRAFRAGGRREDAFDEHDAVATSRLTAPVSIIVPASDADVPVIRASVEALLRLSYPTFEVIVVTESSGMIGEALADWRLEPREFFYRRTIEGGAIRRILRSQEDSRLMIVEKEPGTRGDLLNTGVNLARFRFVAVVPADVTFDEGALLRAMTPALRDAVSVVAVSSHIERLEAGTAVSAVSHFQHLQSLRAIMMTRLFWSGQQRALGSGDSVFIWRRDALVRANGFSQTAGCPELDMMFRLQCVGGGHEPRAVRNPVPFGQAPARGATNAARHAIRQRWFALGSTVRWAISATWAMPACFGLYVATEVVTPWACAWTVGAAVAGAAAGWFGWNIVGLTTAALALGTAATSAAGLLIRGAHPHAPDSAQLRRLLVAAPAELAWLGVANLLAVAGAMSPRVHTGPTRQ